MFRSRDLEIFMFVKSTNFKIFDIIKVASIMKVTLF